MNWCETADGAGQRMAMPDIPLVPLPMVIFALLIGVMFGVMIGKKRAMMMQGGGYYGDKPWMHHGMMGHHHHGDGGAACRQRHHDWAKPEQMASEETGD